MREGSDKGAGVRAWLLSLILSSLMGFPSSFALSLWSIVKSAKFFRCKTFVIQSKLAV